MSGLQLRSCRWQSHCLPNQARLHRNVLVTRIVAPSSAKLLCFAPHGSHCPALRPFTACCKAVPNWVCVLI